MTEQRAGAGAAGEEASVTVRAANTSPVSLRNIARRIDDLPCGARVLMTVTKNEAGVLFWTVQAMNSVER
jgi:hypothetical protein